MIIERLHSTQDVDLCWLTVLLLLFAFQFLSECSAPHRGAVVATVGAVVPSC